MKVLPTVAVVASVIGLSGPVVWATDERGIEAVEYLLPSLLPPVNAAIAEGAAQDPGRNRKRAPVLFDPLKEGDFQEVVHGLYIEHIDVDAHFDLESLIVEMVPERATTVETLFQSRRTSQSESLQIAVESLRSSPDRRVEVITSIQQQEDDRSAKLSKEIISLLTAEQKEQLAERIVRYYGPRSITHPVIRDQLQIDAAQQDTIRKSIDKFEATFRKIGPIASRKSPGRDILQKSLYGVLAGLTPDQLAKYLLLRGEIVTTNGPTAIKGVYSPQTKALLMKRLKSAYSS